MRPIASTPVASMQNIAAPDSASELIWVKCQSVAEQSTAEYWHIGATVMRLASFRSRTWIGEKSVLMLISGRERRSRPICSQPWEAPQPALAATLLLRFDAGGLDELDIGGDFARDQFIHLLRIERHR